VPELGPRALLTLWEAGRTQDPLRRAVTLLAAAQDRPAAKAAEAAAVDVGTRDVLLAGCFRLVAGDKVPACADCPGCGVVLEVPVDVAAVAALAVHEPGEQLSVLVDGTEVPFRLPTTADLIALSGRPPDQARAALLAACLGTEPERTLGAETEAAVEAAMEQAAPAGAIDLLVCCPACGLDSPVPLDVPALLWAEIGAQASALMRDVHALAARYGWTEADVLDLSPRRRAIYLDLAG
jgi:hypothetical protein